MQAFIKSADIGNPNPTVVAFYIDGVDVPEGAHGADVTIVTVPPTAIVQPDPMKGQAMPYLADGWQEQAGAMSFTQSQKVEALRELGDFTLKHGADASKWPDAAKKRKAEIDKKWK